MGRIDSTDPIWQRWDEVDRLFSAALDLPPSARDKFIADSCGGDAELHQAVLTLLESEAESSDVLGAGVGALAWEAFGAVDGDDIVEEVLPVPERVGPYRVIGEAGRGGMGTVYIGERVHADFRQRVAIKVLRRGMDTADIVNRFLVERRILAGLEHPRIAQLIDGGSTDDGRPYFVMRYVEGRPITEYCERSGLGLRERIELFLQVADAVRHAHAKLVVHRDLKPSNILVAPDGQVTLLDFGIAKLVAAEDEGEFLTRTGTRVLTPEYASPEQHRGDPVTTASDIYQLGALLYVLLCGRRPFEAGQAAPGNESASVPPPSTVESASPVPHRALRGDLDTITLKALQHDPERRYPTVHELAGDLERYLSGYPITARPDTWAYRFRRFAQRNPWRLAAAAISVVAMIGYSATVIVQSSRLEAERDRAQLEAEKAAQVTEFLVGLFGSADPFITGGENPTAVEIVDRGAQTIRDELDEQPEVRAALLDALADVYQRLGVLERSHELAQEALALRRTLGPGTADLAVSLRRVGLIEVRLDRYDRADSLLIEALETQRSLFGDVHEEVALTMSWLGRLAARRGDAERADSLLRRASGIIGELGHGDHELVAANLATLGRALTNQGRYSEAVETLHEAVAMHTRLGPEMEPRLLDPYRNLGEAHRHNGDPVQAEIWHRRALELSTRVYGPLHSQTSTTLGNLALALAEQGEFAAAEAMYRTGLRTMDEAGEAAPSWRNRAILQNNFALLLANLGRRAEAEVVYRDNLRLYERELGEAHPSTVLTKYNLAALLHDAGDFAGAEPLFRDVLERDRDTYGPDHPEVAVDMTRLAVVLRDAGNYAEAETLFVDVLPRLRRAYEPGHRRIAEALVGYGGLLARMDRLDEAVPMLRDGLEARRALWTDRHWQTAEAMSLLGGALSRRLDHATAEPLLADGYAILRDLRGAEDRYTRDALRRLVEGYRTAGKLREAEAHERIIAGR